LSSRAFSARSRVSSASNCSGMPATGITYRPGRHSDGC
jgi:hypothetical protein